MNRHLAIALAAAGFAASLAASLAATAQSGEKNEGKMQDLESVEALKTQFNAGAGKPRLLLLVSPTCPMCVDGAAWVGENILKKYPENDIEVYAVWFNMVPGDRKDKWNPEALDDKRVRHYWDEKRVVGKWIAKNVDACDHLGPIDWDSYYLFDENGKWDETFEDVKACGTPILKATEPLTVAAATLFSLGAKDK